MRNTLILVTVTGVLGVLGLLDKAASSLGRESAIRQSAAVKPAPLLTPEAVVDREWVMINMLTSQIGNVNMRPRNEVWTFESKAPFLLAQQRYVADVTTDRPLVRLFVYELTEDGEFTVRNLEGDELYTGSCTVGYASEPGFDYELTLSVDHDSFPAPVTTQALTVYIYDAGGTLVSSPTYPGSTLYAPLALTFVGN